MRLEWIDGRCHLDGCGIHAGDRLEVRWPDGTWELVRIESYYSGRKLLLCFKYHGDNLAIGFDENKHQLRWPTR